MIDPQPGDLFILRSWYMNHVAIYFYDGMVYEAWPPKVRAVDWIDFEQRLAKTRVEVLRNTDLTAQQLFTGRREARKWLGTPYNWLLNYWLMLEGRVHCWEYTPLIQIAMLGPIYGDRELSRVTPRIGKQTSLENGWTAL